VYTGLIMLHARGGFGRYLVLLLGIGTVIVSLIGGASASAAPILVSFSGTVTVSNAPGISGGAPYSGELGFWKSRGRADSGESVFLRRLQTRFR
jgi:hypothetical protein